MSDAAIARTTTEQVWHVLQLRAAQGRRQVHRRALRRCEDLTELLGALSVRQSRDEAARLRSAARLAARDLHRLVAGGGPLPAPRRRGQRPLTPSALDVLVEHLDAALSAAHAGDRAARRHALDLVATVAAGVEALSTGRS
jgi:hypothetical protein